ncbi:hypothetical protein CRYUN_Cryun37aG0067100 [Craigia yunnanensis]
MKAAAEVLGNVALGSSYKALIANGVAVVVKKMREMNVLGKDAFDAKGLEALFAYKTPEAEQRGKVSPKSDVYCLGIIILEILTAKFPSQYLSNGNLGSAVVQWVTSAFSEGRQAELLDPDIVGCQNSLGSMEKLLNIGALCTQTSSEQRLDMKEAIRIIEEIQVEEDPESRS